MKENSKFLTNFAKLFSLNVVLTPLPKKKDL